MPARYRGALGSEETETAQTVEQPGQGLYEPQVATIAPDALASEAADLMVRKNIGHLPVVQGEKVIGIVTRTDIINYLYGMLPA
jgi:tRNA nucleotidyltransferase (CCA-adding enzyme)